MPKGAGAASDGVGPTPLEVALRLELQQLESQLAAARERVEAARAQHGYLSGELSRADDETKDYEAYMAGLAGKEQARIIKISDHNVREIESIVAQTKAKAADFEAQKRELSDSMLACEQDIQRMDRQLADLSHIKTKKAEQEETLRNLQTQHDELQSYHNQKLQELKSVLLMEKQRFQSAATKTAKQLEQQATKDAFICLETQSHRIREENHVLREKLTAAINTNRQLSNREEQLKRQNRELQQQLDIGLTLQQVRKQKLAAHMST